MKSYKKTYRVWPRLSIVDRLDNFIDSIPAAWPWIAFMLVIMLAAAVLICQK